MAAGSADRKIQNRRLLGDEDASMVFETSAGVQVVPTFDSMGLRDDLLRGIYAYGEHSYTSTLVYLTIIRL